MALRDWWGGKKGEPKPEQRAVYAPHELGLRDFFPGLGAVAGQPVSTRSALGIPSVFAAVSSVADTISTLPFPVWRDTGGQPERDRNHPVYHLLNVAPNPQQTAKAWRASVVLDLLTEGEHCSEVVRDGEGNPVGLYRLDPHTVSTRWDRTSDGYQLVWSVSGSEIDPDRLLHVLGFSLDGLRGMSPFGLCRDSLSLTLMLDQFGTSFMRRGARPGGILNTPLGLPEEERAAAREQWAKAQAGASNAGETAVLPAGFEYKPMSLSPEEGQYAESRVHQMRECQRITRTPPHISNDFERQTWSNLQYSRADYVQNTIRPLSVAIEQAINRTLLDNAPGVWAEHVLEGLLRGSFTEQVDALTKAVGAGIYTADEARRLFNLPAKGGAADELKTAPTPTPAPPPPQQDATSGNPQ